MAPARAGARARAAGRRRARGARARGPRRAAGAAARREPRPVLRHAAHRRVVVGRPPAGRTGALHPLPRPRRGGVRDRRPTFVPTISGEACRMSLSPDRLAEVAAGYALDKKAADVVALDRRAGAGSPDSLVIASGGSDRQTKAIHDGIHEGLKKQHGVLPRRVEGLTEARWVLMDYLDCVVHVFTPDTRDYYRLEQLWGDVPRLDLDLDEGSASAAAG